MLWFIKTRLIINPPSPAKGGFFAPAEGDVGGKLSVTAKARRKAWTRLLAKVFKRIAVVLSLMLDIVFIQIPLLIWLVLLITTNLESIHSYFDFWRFDFSQYTNG